MQNFALYEPEVCANQGAVAVAQRAGQMKCNITNNTSVRTIKWQWQIFRNVD